MARVAKVTISLPSAGKPVPPDEVVLAVDGASSGNPGPSGWAAVLVKDGRARQLSGAVARATNNQMELLAVLKGLLALSRPCRVRVLTDSQNVVGWLSLGWKRKDSGVRALAERIEAASRAGGHTLVFQKVPGHAGHPLNERANRLAQRQTRHPTGEPEAIERYIGPIVPAGADDRQGA